MNTHNFTGFKLEVVPNCPQAPMTFMVNGPAFCSIELPSTGEFYICPADDGSDYHTVMLKMNSKRDTPPEVQFHVLSSELERFKKVSVLPVIE